MSLTVAIIGNGDSTVTNIEDNLDDFLPFECRVLIPNQVPNYGGLDKVLDWLTAADIPTEPHADPVYGLNNFAGDKALIVLGTEDIIVRDIQAALDAGIPVYDLCRGLFAVTSLDGSESNAETTDEVPEVEDTPPVPETVEEILADLIKRVERLEEQMFAIRRDGFGTVPERPPVLEATIGQEKIKYWHNTSNDKKRKAGKSKARPNEVELWLTEEEAALL